MEGTPLRKGFFWSLTCFVLARFLCTAPVLFWDSPILFGLLEICWLIWLLLLLKGGWRKGPSPLLRKEA